MIVRSGATEVLSPEAPASPREIPNRARERARVVKRLKVIVATHVEASARIDFPLGMPDLLAVVAALRADADGLNPAAALAGGEEVSRYEALPKDFWRECLDALPSELATLKPRRP